ncbi:MAG: hypothetical protein K8T91_13475 [Planctomycetes bacterium]|nr:hypothetical protein [Planctomycetota bacterium]
MFSAIDACSRSTADLAGRLGGIERQFQIQRHDAGHLLPLLDRSSFRERDGLDAAGVGHRDQIRLRQPGFPLLVDELLDRPLGHRGHVHLDPGTQRIPHPAADHGHQHQDDNDPFIHHVDSL